jgi:hypothetical protein
MSVLPETITKNNIYTSLLPSFVISYKLSQKSNLRLNYRTSTQVPSGYQLLENLDKIDNTSFYQGRNDLNEQYTHSIFGRFQNVGSDFSKMFMWNFHLMSRSNFLANNTIYLQQDTIIDEHRFAKGNTFSRPINLNGYLDGRTYIVYGFPLFELPINCNFNFGLGYTKTPGIYNGISYLSENYSGNSMLVLTSNISSDLDFTLTAGITSNYTKMNTTSVSNSRYNTFFGNINFNWIFWEGFFIGGNAREMFYTGLKGDAKTNYSLVNLNIGKKLFNNAAEIKLSVYDAFDQNKSIQTNVTDYYREDVYSNVLRRYALLTFTLNYKNFYSKN